MNKKKAHRDGVVTISGILEYSTRHGVLGIAWNIMW